MSLLILLILPASLKVDRVDYREARYNNVCKDLKGDVLLYFVFVDSKHTMPWTEFDIQSTIDSIRAALTWIQLQAKGNEIPLNIIADFYIGPEFTTISRNLPEDTVLESLTGSSPKKVRENMKRWSDGIAKIVGDAVTIREKDGIPQINAPRNKERLISYLRDENEVESVALFYLVNNYFKADISVPVNTFRNDDVEYAIVSYKYPSELAHNFLHLYGAADMYGTVLRRSKKKIQALAAQYPDEIMQNPYARNIDNLKISEYTKYLIGWSQKLDPSLEWLMTDRRLRF